VCVSIHTHTPRNGEDKLECLSGELVVVLGIGPLGDKGREVAVVRDELLFFVVDDVCADGVCFYVCVCGCIGEKV
jgi:hypothetical protein